jgi:hypothetical protein
MSEKSDLGTTDLTVRSLRVLKDLNSPTTSHLETRTVQNESDAVLIRAIINRLEDGIAEAKSAADLAAELAQDLFDDMQTQLDDRIEVFISVSTVDPSDPWITTIERHKHIKDLWYQEDTKTWWRYEAVEE